MTTIQRNRIRWVALWSVLALAIGTLAIGETLFAQRQPGDQSRVLQNQIGVQNQRGPLVPNQGFANTPLAFRNVAQQAFPSIVSIEAFGRGSGSCRGSGPIHQRGSGFSIGPDGGIVTSSRVVAGADRVRIRTSDGTTYLASSVATDPLTDLSVLRFSPALNIPAMPLANSDAAQIGDWVLAVGNKATPDVLMNEQVAAGVISSRGPGPGVARREDLLQTDIPFGSVSAGSPLLNLNGEVVGIHTTLGANSDGTPQGGVIIPSNLLNTVSRQLIDNGTVQRAYLGVSTQSVDSQMAKQFALPANSGALVNQVLPNSPAAQANILPGDVVQTVNGIPVADGHRLQGIADSLPIGQSIPVGLVRNGNKMTVNVVPAAIPAALAPTPPASQRVLDTTASRPVNNFNDLGVATKPLTPETSPAWAKLSQTNGVLVDSVQPGSPAAEAGLRPGMVIRKVGGSTISAPADLAVANANWADKSGVLMLVSSSRGSRFLIVGGNE
ncbi:MAG: protease Do [Planctomycetaceae bacterium]|nr:protease Do [Planctomycetaceae bacterium]